MCHCDFIAATYDAGNAIVLPLGNKPGTAAHLDALAYMLSIVYTKCLELQMTVSKWKLIPYTSNTCIEVPAIVNPDLVQKLQSTMITFPETHFLCPLKT
uniref:Uncharacterized protein n=1 Tax=Physcomitrium patens TaxID=3218 RepID=A0A7I4BSQ5_PHYPA